MAQQLRQFDPHAQAAADTITREVKDRYGVDVDNLGADPQAVRAALAQVELDRDLAVRGERGTAATEYTQAALAVQEADRLDARAAAAQLGPDAGDTGDRSADTTRSDEAAGLELQAREYELLAAQGGTPEQSPAPLIELASDAQSQAQLHRDVDQGRENAPTAPVGADQGRASAERSESQLTYDSAAPREAMANALASHRIPQETIDVRMRADIAQGRPASEAAAPASRVNVPKTHHVHGVDRSAGRAERSR